MSKSDVLGNSDEIYSITGQMTSELESALENHYGFHKKKQLNWNRQILAWFSLSIPLWFLDYLITVIFIVARKVDCCSKSSKRPAFLLSVMLWGGLRTDQPFALAGSAMFSGDIARQLSVSRWVKRVNVHSHGIKPFADSYVKTDHMEVFVPDDCNSLWFPKS